MNKTTIRQLTTSTLLWLAACVIVGLASKAAYAQGTPNKLESIDVQNVAGQQVQLTLRHSSPPSEPVAFTIDNPARISLDLANTALAIPSRRIDIHTGGVDSVLAAEAAGRTRLVLNLDRLLPYQTRVSGNDIIVTVADIDRGKIRLHIAAPLGVSVDREEVRFKKDVDSETQN